MNIVKLSRRAFSLIEVIIAIAILSIVAVFSVPMYRNYQILSDLNLAADSFVQALNRAKFLSQTGEGDSKWGFHPASGVMFQGEDYSSRYTLYDETYGFSDTIVVTGLPEVTFSKLDGDPSATGSIVLTALNEEERIIYVTGGAEGVLYNPTGNLGICHIPSSDPSKAHQLKVPEAAWPAHQAHGDIIGPCPE